MTTPTTSADSFALAAEKTRAMAGEVAMLAEWIRSGEIDPEQAAALVGRLAWDVDKCATVIGAGADMCRAYDLAISAFESVAEEIERADNTQSNAFDDLCLDDLLESTAHRFLAENGIDPMGMHPSGVTHGEAFDRLCKEQAIAAGMRPVVTDEFEVSPTGEMARIVRWEVQS